MSGHVETLSAVRAAGDTDAGVQREVNEDRFHVDVQRRLFMVVDGVGGQAAGGKAADTAVAMLRSRLERQTGPVVQRLREAITVANNEIHRVAALRPEWNGMACVLTAVVLEGDQAIVGHVGDTRLYKLRHGRIEKVTRDHSPVGEREDARELSELEAMRHPRRNEVYRDVGSDPHNPDDPDFIDVREIAFEADAALLLCSDGLTDLIDASSITEIVSRSAGQPREVVRALIDAANDAGGKDNVTVVYVEGERFAHAGGAPKGEPAEITRRLGTAVPADAAAPGAERVRETGGGTGERIVRLAVLMLLSLVILLVLARSAPEPSLAAPDTSIGEDGRILVQSSQSIGAALAIATAGTTVVVEPGEYRETLTLKSNVRLVSMVRHGAVLRLPGAASEAAAAIVARGVSGAAVEGFRLIGDAATPLGTGVALLDADLSISDVDIAGASRAAIDVDGRSRLRLIGSDIHDNPGAAIAVAAGANATISHNVFMRNGSASDRQPMLGEGQGAVFVGNVFVGMGPDVLSASPATRASLARDNWFLDPGTTRVTRPRPSAR